MRAVALFLMAGLLSAPAIAQTRRPAVDDERPVPTVDPRAGQTVTTAPAGRVGQRQSAADTSRAINAQPMARVANRLSNRVQSRLRNRIDRNYDPAANAASPFRVAADEVRATVRRPR
jgi:hypothetical protein